MTKNLFIKVFMMRRLCLVMFLLQGKVLFHTCQQVACEMFICRKRSEHLVVKILSLVVFDSNCSSKTVKCSFFNQIIVYQSFYCAPLTFNYVLLQGKVVCFGTHFQVACLDRVYLCRKNVIFRLCLLHEDGIEACIPGSIWQKRVNFWLNGKNNLPFN